MREAKYRKPARITTGLVWLFAAASSEAKNFRFPESIVCTPSISVAASVQTGVLTYPRGGDEYEWRYIGEEQYIFLNDGEEVLFSTRHLNSGAILEMMRTHTTYSIDLVNESFVMVQAMAGDPEIPHPAIGALVSGSCSISPSASESAGESGSASNKPLKPLRLRLHVDAPRRAA